MKLSPSELEKVVQRTLQELPDLPAPAGWEKRVWAEIDRRRALPWWRQSFGAWPAALRAAFCLLSAAAGAGLVAVRFPDWPFGSTLLRSGGETAAAVGRSVPPAYFYGAIALAAAGYAAIVLLGAATYRALSIRRPA
jgi:hypothetical protein